MNKLTLVVPHNDNEGNSLHELQEKVQRDLIKTYGGYSGHNGFGGWENAAGRIYREPVTVYEIFTDKTLPSLYEIASEVKRIGKQECVFVAQEPARFECL